MKKRQIVRAVLFFAALFFFTVCPAEAQEKEKFTFELTIDGRSQKEAKQGDIVTVVLYLRRTDSKEAYTMFAMQDEIRYDSRFFKLVEGSVTVGEGILSSDIAMVDGYREVYMNYVSLEGGREWKADTLIGSFQLEVLENTGVSAICSCNSIVSKQDGSAGYDVDTNDVTVILSTECTVTFRSNGGSKVEEQVVLYGEKAICPQEPVREGYRFAGWYRDIQLQNLWDFDQDVVQENMSLYAKWTEEKQNQEEESGRQNPCPVLFAGLLLAVLILLFVLYRKHLSASHRTTLK